MHLQHKVNIMSKQFIITCASRTNVSESRPLTISEAVDYYSYTLTSGSSWSHEKGNKKINCNPKTIKSLITNLNNAVNNSAADGYANITYTAKEVSPT